jgi:hypothetical protein
MIDESHLDARLRALDSSPPERRDRVAETDWGRALQATITAGATGRGRRRARRALGVAAATATAVAIAGLMAALFVSTGHDESPAAGRSAALVATPVPGGAALTPESLRATASLLVERAGLLGVEGVTATPRGTDVIDVALPEETPEGLLSQIAAPGRLLMVPDQRVGSTPARSLDAAVRVAQRAAGVPVTGGDASDLPEGFLVAREDAIQSTPVTSDYVVLRKVLPVSGADIVSARMEPSSTEPLVAVQFTDDGATAFTALTRRLAEDGQIAGRLQALAILLDGRVITNPVVDYETYPTGIDGSNGAQIPVPEDLDAAVVAANLSSGPLPVDLTEAPGEAPPDDPVARAYLGVSCPRANDPTCDRVGLSVTLREGARSVEAAIDGRRMRLDDPDWSGPEEGGLRTIFAGFLSPAGLDDGALRIPEAGTSGGRWMGDPPVSAPVDLFITAADGTTTTVTLEVQLSPGWG